MNAQAIVEEVNNTKENSSIPINSFWDDVNIHFLFITLIKRKKSTFKYFPFLFRIQHMEIYLLIY